MNLTWEWRLQSAQAELEQGILRFLRGYNAGRGVFVGCS
jgi:hypothetical protein